MSVTIRLPWPDRWLHPNARPHHMKKARATKAARSQAVWWTLSANAGCVFKGYDGPINAVITFHPPDRRKRDRDGLIANLKAYQDGIADAVGADDGRWIPTYHVGEPVKRGCVTVTLSARDTGGTASPDSPTIRSNRNA